MNKKIGHKALHYKLFIAFGLVLTDWGGIQEETTILAVPCVTIRVNTEPPITVTHGTNVVAGVKKENIINAAHAQLTKFSEARSISVPPFWDGKAAERIVEILAKEPAVRIQNRTGYLKSLMTYH